jgi:YVTN family beta-propeller protein
MRFRIGTASLAFFALLQITSTTIVNAQSKTPLVGPQTTNFSTLNPTLPAVLLPNGQTITPAGTQIAVNDRPMGIAISPDNTTAAVVAGSNFAGNALQIINLATNTVTQTITGNDTFVGVAFSPSGQNIYVGGGASNNVQIYTLAGGHWSLTKTVAISGGAPSGLSISPDGSTLYVALNEKSTLGIINLSTDVVTQVSTGGFPYTTVATKDGSTVYVSNWGGRLPVKGDLTDGSNPVVVTSNGLPSNGTISVYSTGAGTVTSTIQVGLHPSAMALSPDGSTLYVCNSTSDSISVISTATNTVVDTIPVQPYSEAPLGTEPNAIAVSADGTTLYVANGANNSISVIQPGFQGAILRGMIPVGWFPDALALTTANGGELLVGNGYGFGSIAPATGCSDPIAIPSPPPVADCRSYTNRAGEISVIPVPVSSSQLKKYTAQVQLNITTLGAGQSPTLDANQSTPVVPGSPIQHVIYILRENRTYDEVYGDMGYGNSMADLAIYGSAVTPNAHAIAQQFALFDNFYNGGDQSSLGHQWCDEAWAADYSHKYGNGRNDFAGTNPMAFAPTGFIWDDAITNGLTARIYGEFANSFGNPVKPGTTTAATWSTFYNQWVANNAAIAAGTPGVTPLTNMPVITVASSVKSAQRILATDFPGFQLQIPDQIRTDVFLQDFNSWTSNGTICSSSVPNLIVMSIPADHTNGTSSNFPVPASMVADNDLAIGRLIDTVSHSACWASTAIFVTEDDSQDGVDHVDGHRGPIIVASPYTQHNASFVDSTLYSNPNMVRTIESLLGLPPMNQFDNAAQTMANAFMSTPNLAPYNHVLNQTALNNVTPPVTSMNGLRKKMSVASAKMDFSKPDAAPENLLNHILWWEAKGYDVPYPGEKTVKVPPFKVVKDDDDK